MSATPGSKLADPEQLIADLQRQLAACRAERDEALEHQTATAEMLQVINSSPDDLQPVFDAMLDKATQLCGVAFGLLWIYDGERFRAAALHGVPAEFAEWLRQPVEVVESAALAEVARRNRSVQIADLADSEAYRVGNALRRATVDLGGGRTGLAVPLLKDDALLGIFAIYRQEVRPFSERQIALVENFAAQAVIAIENAHLLNAAFGMSADRAARLRQRRVRLGETHLGRTAVERAPVHVDDVQHDPTLSGPDRGRLGRAACDGQSTMVFLPFAIHVDIPARAEIQGNRPCASFGPAFAGTTG